MITRDEAREMLAKDLAEDDRAFPGRSFMLVPKDDLRVLLSPDAGGDQGASRDHALTDGDGQGNPTLAASDTARFRCKRCGRDEIDCRANGCERGPCPMEFVG